MCSWPRHAIHQCLCACSNFCLGMQLVVYYLCMVYAHLLLVLWRSWILAGLYVTIGFGNGGMSLCHRSCCGWCALALLIAFCLYNLNLNLNFVCMNKWCMKSIKCSSASQLSSLRGFCCCSCVLRTRIGWFVVTRGCNKRFKKCRAEGLAPYQCQKCGYS